MKWKHSETSKKFFFKSSKFLNFLKSLEFVGIKAKGRILKRVFQENKARQIFRKTNVSYIQGVRNVRFSENLACFAFLLPQFWDSAFCLITGKIFDWVHKYSYMFRFWHKCIMFTCLTSSSYTARQVNSPNTTRKSFYRSVCCIFL